MGHRDARHRCFLLALPAAVILLFPVLTQSAGAATVAGDPPDEPGEEPTDDTLLSPAEEDSVSVAPVGEPSDAPADAVEEPTADNRHGLLDLHDVAATAAVGWALLALLALAATWIMATRLARMLYVWRSPGSIHASGFGPTSTPETSFSLVVPAGPGNPNDSGLRATLKRLIELDHPAYEILVVVGHGDSASREVTLALAARHPDRLRVVSTNRQSRAAGLNTALAECQGEVVGVCQPGDDVHPQLLERIDSCITGQGADAVQPGLQLVARSRKWFRLHYIVDRYFWYRSRLQFHARQHFTPIDASTAFVRADILRRCGGWDEESTDEGCDLGVRLSVEGAVIVVGYDHDLATRRQAPVSVRALMRQETQRMRGFLQALRRGVWRRLPRRRQRLLARATLARPLAEAFTSVAVITALVAVLVIGASPPIAALALLPAIPALMLLAVEVAGLGELQSLHWERRYPRDLCIFVISVVPYQLLVAASALIALVTELATLGRRRRTLPVAPTATSALQPSQGPALSEEPAEARQIIDGSNGRQPPHEEAELGASTSR